MRFAGLKVIVDGPPLDSLQDAGKPVSDFFPSVQRRYADRFLCLDNVSVGFAHARVMCR